MKRTPAKSFIICLSVLLIAGCGMVTKEVFTINPDLSGKCAIEVKMYADTSRIDANLSSKDSLYGISPAIPNFHKAKFSRKDAMTLAIKIIRTRGVEIWSNIHFGMSKKRDMIYFTGVAYFRNIEQVHFSMLDSALKVNKNADGTVTFSLQPQMPKLVKQVSDDEATKKVTDLRKNAFYIRPILADQLNPTEATVTYNLPGAITSSSIYGQQGDNIVQLTLTGNEILRYADSLGKNQQLAEEEYKETGGKHISVMEPLFNRIVWDHGIPAEVTFKPGDKYQFQYNAEVRNAMMYFDNYMEETKLFKFDSISSMREEREERKRPEEYGVIVVNKSDSTAKKPYFNDMSAIQSNDTITVTGELSEDIKAEPEAKIHIMKLIAGSDQDITDSIVAHTKITAELQPESGKSSDKGPKRKANFMFIVHFPKGVKEISIQGRLSTELAGKPGPQVPFKIKQVAVTLGKRQQ